MSPYGSFFNSINASSLVICLDTIKEEKWAFLLSILGLIGPGFWDIKSPNPIKFTNDHLTRATLGLKFNPNKLDKSMSIASKYYLGDTNNQSNINWSVSGEKIKNLVIDKMEKDLLPKLRENIIEDFYLTPDYFEKDLNTKFGSGFSIQPKFTQSAYFRFHNKSEIYDGLYFVGAGTHPGAGVPGVLSSAKVLDKIL